MGLKDFDVSKIVSWRYNDIGTKQKSQEFMDEHSGTKVDGTRDLILEKFLDSQKESKPDASNYDLESNPPSPQTFEANGYTVTGKRDKINEMFLDSKLKSNAYASDLDPLNMPQSFEANGYTITGIRDIISKKFVNDPKTLLIGDDTIFEPNVDDTPLNSLTQQQNYTVDNFQGSYKITGKGAFSTGDELDTMKGLSLIISNWAEMVDAKTLISYKVARVGKNATHGHLEIPYSYHNFGSTSVDAEPFSYGKLSPNIGWTVEIERGGDAVDGIVKDYEKILESGDMWERFVRKQSDAQTVNEITRGYDFIGDSAFNSFNSLDYLVAFGSTAQPYRLGNIIQGVPRYAENTPVIDAENTNVGVWRTDNTAVSVGDDFHDNSKMLYLYKNFILTDPPEPPTGWAAIGAAFATNYWNSIHEPFPIAPTMNIVKKPGYGTVPGSLLAWTDKNLAYGGQNAEGNQKKYSTLGQAGNEISEDLFGDEGKFNFFSKSGPGHLIETYDNENKLEAASQSDINAEINKQRKTSTLKQKMIKDPAPPPAPSPTDLHIPLSVKHSLGGENTLEKFLKDTRALVNKYSTLGYSHLDNEIVLKDGESAKKINYEKSLHSPSEINAGIIGDKKLDETLIKLDASKAAEAGVRFDGRKKVYGIGKQGLMLSTQADPTGPLKSVNKYGFKGQVNTQDGALFGDHVDKVNALPYGEANPDLDFVPLIFHDVYNKKDIQFRALFSEDITDTISPSWNPINYIGRTTAVYTYQNTARSISFGFTIFPKTKQEFPILLEKVNYLVGMCYPNLDDYFRASGPLIKLTAGDIVKSQLGFLSECSVTFPSSESPWETDAGLQFTKKIDVSIGFTYIGNNIPVAKGVHYNLDWLDGEHYTEEGVNWKTDADGKGGPTRKNEGDISKLMMQDIITDATPADSAATTP